MKQGIILLFFVFMVLVSKSQNPPFLHWKKINTPHFEVVFPEAISEEGQRVGNLLEKIYEPDAQSLQIKPKKFTVFLFNQTITSNGYVRIAPRYSAWYITPMQEIDVLSAVDWTEILAIHEYRHVVQQFKQRQGFTRFASFFYGQYAEAGLSWSIPNWFSEGDAVCLETALTNGGRGRIPDFDMGIRANELSNRRFTYYKAYMRSLKDYCPDHYRLGYLMTAYARNHYQADIWSRVLDRTTRFSWYPFAFSRSLKHETGLTNKLLYQKTLDELDSLWTQQIATVSVTNHQLVTASHKEWTNYYNPTQLADGSIIARKYGLADASILIKINPNGEEEKLHPIEITDYISVANNMVSWSSEKGDVRWSLKSYSNIWLYDIEAHKTKQLTHKTRLFAPALSPDATKIAAVEFTPELQSSLVIIDASNGNIIKRLNNSENAYIRTPAWSPDGKSLVYTQTTSNQLSLVMVDTTGKNLRKLIENTTEPIASPSFYKSYILFNAPITGIGNIHAIDTFTNQRFELVNAKFGAYNAKVSDNGNTLLFQNYGSNGYNISKISLDSLKFKKFNYDSTNNINYYKQLVEQESGLINSQPETFKIKRYSHLLNFFNFHSWGIFPDISSSNPVPDAPVLKFLLMSDNKLNTANLRAGITYDFDRKEHRKFVKLSYTGFFPILDVEAGKGNRTNYYLDDKQKEQSYSWNETDYSGGVRIPLNFSNNAFISRLTIDGRFSTLIRESTSYSGRRKIKDTTITSLSFSLSHYGYYVMAARDVGPRKGYSLNLDFRKPTCMDTAYQYAVDFALYFPGVFKHHSIRFYGGLERQYGGDNYGSYLRSPRGYEYYFLKQYQLVSFDYSLPLFYPDWALGGLIYMKRFKANAFYDYAWGENNGSETSFSSAGLSISLDFNPLTQPYDFNIGVRMAYRFDDDTPVYKMFFVGVGF